MRKPAQAIRVGALWGAGHAVGAGALGAIGALAKSVIDVNFLSSWAEFLVGIVLCGVGIWALLQTRKLVVHSHPHEHEAQPRDPALADDPHHDHDHVHLHIEPKHEHQAHRAHHGTSFGVGVLHGAAGTGHLLGVLPSLALPPVSAAIYLTAYGLAAIASMTLFSAVIGLVGKRMQLAWLRWFLRASGVVAIALGVWWMVTGVPSGS
jgi:uncharacterized membrane protein YfcA